MSSLRLVMLSGSLLSAALTTGCLGGLSPAGGDRALSPNPPTSSTSQVRTNLGALARGQQAYYLENGQFTSTVADLDVAVRLDEGGYQIAIADQQPTQVIMTATPESPGNPNLAAGVFAVTDADGPTTVVALCESETGIPFPRLAGTEAVCDDAQ
jgi:hypothetical protein